MADKYFKDDPDDPEMVPDEFAADVDLAVTEWLLDPNVGTVDDRIEFAESLDRYDLVDRIRASA
jgi:hypothetical protein